MLSYLNIFLLLTTISLTTTVKAISVEATSNIGYFLHVSDIHYDPEYYPSGPDNCIFGTKVGTGCCRKDNIPIDPYNQSSKWGDFNCDVPSFLVQHIFNWTKYNIPKVDYIFYTGDSASHHVITQTVRQNLDSINTINNIINYNYPKTQLYQVVGNHDTYPIDQTVPILYPYILKNISNAWSKWLNTQSITSTQTGGYYSQYITSNVKVISINSIHYDSDNIFQIKSDEEDVRSGYQWNWIENELKMSRANGDKVLIINHIPPGSGEANDYYVHKLINVTDRYRDMIFLQLYGHTHEDLFRLFYNSTKKEFVGYGMIPGSMMTSDHDPCFRVFVYDKTTWNILDYHQYSCSLSQTIKNNRIECRNTYNFTSEYGLEGNTINLDTMVKLYHALNSTNAIQKYHHHYRPGSNNNNCDDQCKQNYLEEIVFTID